MTLPLSLPPSLTERLRMFEPIRRGAAMTAQRLNWERAWSGALCTAASGLDPTNISCEGKEERGNQGERKGRG